MRVLVFFQQLLNNSALPKCSLNGQITCVVPEVSQHLLSITLPHDPTRQNLRLLVVGSQDGVGVGGSQQEDHNSHQCLQPWLDGGPDAHYPVRILLVVAVESLLG